MSYAKASIYWDAGRYLREGERAGGGGKVDSHLTISRLHNNSWDSLLFPFNTLPFFPKNFGHINSLEAIFLDWIIHWDTID